jgi:glutathione S-transferase
MLDGHTFLAGERFTIADIWLYVWLEFVGQPFDRSLRNLAPWFSRIAARPRSQPACTLRASRVVCAAEVRSGPNTGHASIDA